MRLKVFLCVFLCGLVTNLFAVYYSRGYIESSVFDAGDSAYWDTITWGWTSHGCSLVIKVRTASDTSMSDALDWSLCEPADSDSVLANLNSVQNGHRYAQYRIEFYTRVPDSTPEINWVRIQYRLFNKPYVSIDSIKGTHDTVTIYYFGDDPKNRQLITFAWQFKRKGETEWSPVTSSQIFNNDWKSPGHDSIFWNTTGGSYNLAGIDDSVDFRMKVMNYAGYISDFSEPYRFYIDNNIPPSCSLEAITNEQIDSARVKYWVSDPEKDLVKLTCKYSLDGVNFFDATISDTFVDTLLYDSAIYWLAYNDIAGVDDDSVWFLVIPSDSVYLHRDYGQGDTIGPFHMDANKPPSISVSKSIPNNVAGNIIIPCTLSDQEYDTLNITVKYKYKLEGSTVWSSWLTPTLYYIVKDIDSSHYDTCIVWMSATDQFDTMGYAVFKITPYDSLRDKDTGAFDTSNIFYFNNKLLPGVTVGLRPNYSTPDTEVMDSVRIFFKITDLDTDHVDDTITVTCQYFVDGAWYTTTNILGDTLFIDSTGAGADSMFTREDTIIWLSKLDLWGKDRLVNFRLIPHEFGGSEEGEGRSDTTGTFHLDNNAPPILYYLSAPTGEVSDTITFEFAAKDTEGDTITFIYRYSLDNGVTWDTTTNVDTNIGTSHDTITCKWASRQDVNYIDKAGFLFEIIPNDNDPGESDTANFHLDNNYPPEMLSITTPAGEQHDTVVINYTLSDSEGDTLGIICRYYFKGAWDTATTSSDTFPIDTGSYTGGVLWFSLSDIPDTDAYVKFKIVVHDSDIGDSLITDSFKLDNYQNQWVNILDLATEQSDSIEIPFLLNDPVSGDSLTIYCEYSLDSNTWYHATIIGDTSGFAPGNYQDTIIWLSKVDADSIEQFVWFRVKAHDGWDYGPWGYKKFKLDNNEPPACTIKFYPPQDTGDVLVKFVLTDRENDTITIDCKYSHDTTTWFNANVTILPSTNNPDSVIWHTQVDLPDTECTVLFMITPQDSDPGVQDTATIRVDNWHEEFIDIWETALPVPEATDSIKIKFEVCDPIGKDSLTILALYSTDSISWDTATIIANDTFKYPYGSPYDSLIWASKEDLPNYFGYVWFKVYAHDGWRYSTRVMHDTNIVKFKLDNNEPPEATITYPAWGTEDTGTILIKFYPADPETDSVSVTYWYSLDSINWDTATCITYSITTNDTDSVRWQSKVDLPDTECYVWFRVVPSDSDPGTPGIVKLLVDNWHNQSIAISPILDEQSDTVAIKFTLQDNIGQDTLRIHCEYKYTGGWNSATISGDTSGLAWDYSGDTLVLWLSKLDIPSIDDSVWFKITPFDGWAWGIPDSVKFKLDNNSAPKVTILTYPQEDTGDITFTIYPEDAEGDTLTYLIEFSLDNITFQTASCTLYPDIVNDTDTIVWHTRLDPPVNDSECYVWFRVVPIDNDTGVPCTVYLRVDNYHDQYPVLSLLNPGEQSATVPIVCTLHDEQGNDTLTISCWYSTDGTSFNLTNNVSSFGVQYYPGNYIDTIDWYSNLDLSGYEGWVWFVVRANDGWRLGVPDTIKFRLDNNVPPAVNITSYPSEDSADIKIKYSATDNEGDTIFFIFRYSIDTGNTWDTTTNVTNYYKDSLVWHTLIDLPSNEKYCLFEIIPSDSDIGKSDTAYIIVDNYHDEWVDIHEWKIVGEQRDSVYIPFSLHDTIGHDTLRIECKWDTGGGWQSAVIIGQTVYGYPYSAEDTIIWLSKQNLLGFDDSVRFAIFVYDKINGYWATGLADSCKFKLDNNEPPQVTIITYPQEDTGDIEFKIYVGDVEGDLDTLIAEFSLDSITWYGATCIGYPIVVNDTDTIIWQTKLDAPVNDSECNVWFKLTPMDKDTGTPSVVYLRVDNYHEQTLTITPVAGEQSDSVTISFSIFDNIGRDSQKIHCEYIWQGITYPATVVGDTSGLVWNYSGSVVWLSKADLDSLEGTVKFIIRPSDYWRYNAGDTIEFFIDNNEPPELEIISYASEDTGHIPIRIWMNDREGDSIKLLCEYSIDKGLTWDTTSSIQIQNDTLDTFILIWTSGTDLPNQERNTWFKITPRDTDYGLPDTAFIKVDNYHSQVASLPDTLPEQHGDVLIKYTLKDSFYDVLSIKGFYFDPDSNKWFDATLYGKTNYIDSIDYSDTLEITWQSGVDLPHREEWVWFKLVPYDQWLAGVADSLDFLVDNNAPPVVAIDPVYESSDSAIIVITVSDSELDTVWFDAFYVFRDTVRVGSVKYIPTASVYYGGVYPDTVIWYFDSLLTNRDTFVKFFVIPRDHDTGSYYYTYIYDTLVHVDNYHLEECYIDSTGDSIHGVIPDTSQQHVGAVYVFYRVIDSTFDMLKLKIEYALDSVDTGTGLHYPRIWQSAYTKGDTIIDTAQYIDTLIWYSPHDLMPFKGFVWVRLIVFDQVYNSWYPGDTSAPKLIKLYNNSPPRVTMIETPSGEQSGDVRIRFQVVDAESNIVDITPYYVLDGVNYPATCSGDLTGLYPSGDSVYEVIWYTTTDINLCDAIVKFMIVPKDSFSEGNSALTGEFRVDNFHLQKVTTLDSLGEEQMDIRIPFTIIDSTWEQNVGIEAKYSLDRINWETPKLTGATYWFDSSAYDTAVIWNSFNNLGYLDTIAYFVIFAFDNWDTNYNDTAMTIIHVDNNKVPIIKIVSVIGDTFQSGFTHDITFYYRLSDNEHDVIRLIMEFKPEGDTIWHKATVASDTIVDSSEYENILGLMWESFADLPTYDDSIWVRITPYDRDKGRADSIKVYLVNNTAPVITNITTPQVEQQDTVWTIVTIQDPDMDSLWIEVTFSTDTGKIWQSATIGDIIDSTYFDTTKFIIPWLSQVDLPDTDIFVQLRYIVSEKYHPYADTGTGDLFKIDNIKFAVVESVYPPPDTLVWCRIYPVIKFSLPIDTSTIKGNITIKGLTTGLNYTGDFVLLEPNVLQFVGNTYFAGKDVIQITVTRGVKDIYGDSIANDTVYEFRTGYLSDYDLNDTMEFNDFTKFAVFWNADSVEFEIGPALGKSPNMVCTPDNKMDAEDISVFLCDWDYYESKHNTRQAKASKKETSLKITVNVLQNDGVVKILISYWGAQALFAGQVIAEFDEQIVDYKGYIVKEDFRAGADLLEYNHKEKGFAEIDVARLSRENPYISGRGEFMECAFEITKSCTINLAVNLCEKSGDEIVYSTLTKSIFVKYLPKKFVNRFEVMPNPVSEKLLIKYSVGGIVKERIPVKIMLYDITGRLKEVLLDEVLRPGEYELQKQLKLVPGIYFVKFETKDYRKIKKIIVIK